MYAEFFGLKQEPFSIAPDPHYLFMSERHREALAHLVWGVNAGGGFVLLSGEIGAGKTTVCRCFLEQIPKRCNVAYIFNPKLTVIELLQTICDEFRIPQPVAPAGGLPTAKQYIDVLNEFLLRMHSIGQNNLLIIDEAQNLSADVLEQLRLLTNLETHDRKLLQIVLIGQPELRDLLARPELEQLAQRVVARFHLKALSEEETVQYVRHRMQVAGLTRPLPFDAKALRRIHRLTRGVPRRINLLCDRALLGAYGLGQDQVTTSLVDGAAEEVFGRISAVDPPRRQAPAWVGTPWLLVGGGVALALVAGAIGWWGAARSASSAPVQAAAEPVAASVPADPVATASAATALAPGEVSGDTPSDTSNPAPASAPPGSGTVGVLGSRAGESAAADAATAAGDALQVAQVGEVFGGPVRSEDDAWRELAALWGVGDLQGEPCAALRRASLQCYSARGSLNLVRDLDRPVILTLRDQGDRAAYVLLTALDDRSATLTFGGESHQVSLQSLTRLWRGDWSTIWRAPEPFGGNLSQGQAGPAVAALVRQLATAQQEPMPADLRRFTPEVTARVLNFQTTHGLTPDGIVGPTTFMQLNRATGVDEPRLGRPSA